MRAGVQACYLVATLTELRPLPSGLGAMTEWTDVVGLVVQKYGLEKLVEEGRI